MSPAFGAASIETWLCSNVRAVMDSMLPELPVPVHPGVRAAASGRGCDSGSRAT